MDYPQSNISWGGEIIEEDLSKGVTIIKII
jgi:hypothetical protein